MRPIESTMYRRGIGARRLGARLVRFTPGAALLVTAAVVVAFLLRNAFVAAHQILGWVVACSLVALLIDPVVNLVQRAAAARR